MSRIPPRPGLVVCDLDRTLTDTRLRIVRSALAALQVCRRRGIPTVLASGRSRAEMHRRTRILAGFDGLILEGGSLIGTVHRLRPLIPGFPKRELLQWLDSKGIPCRSGEASISVDRAMTARLARHPLRNRLTLTPNRDRLDVTPKGADKGSAVRHLATRLRTTGPILAFGDGENDVALLEAADLRVAVRNAVPLLKRRADALTRYDGGRGVADYLMRHVLQPTRASSETPA